MDKFCNRCGISFTIDDSITERILWDTYSVVRLCDGCNVDVQLDFLHENGNPPFKCPAKVYSGPGHQSGHDCEIVKPHDPEGDHEADHGELYWTGLKGFSDRGYW